MFLIMTIPLYVSLLSVFSFHFINCSRSVEENKYTDLRSTFTYVDKTPLIYELLQHRYLFISAPSKFGKTSNIDMINLFLGRHHSKQDIEHYFIFTKIWESDKFVDENIGKHPIIHFSYKANAYSKDLEHTVTAFKTSLYNAFSDHVYMLDSKKINEEEMKLFKIYTDYTRSKQMSTVMVERGLSFLAEVLYKYYGKPAILLADDFGAGITDGVLQNHVDLPSIIGFYSSVLNHTFHNQSLISHALLSAENWLHGVSGPGIELLEHVSFNEKVELSRFYGFTHDEVEHLLDKNVENVTLKQKKEVLRWYCGYSSSDGLFKICNPHSIIQYVSRKTETVYWTGSVLGFDLVRMMVKDEHLKKNITELYWRRTVDMNPNLCENIFDVQVMAKKISETPEVCGDFLMKLLLESGYVTPSGEQQLGGNLTLKFPNEEVRSVVNKLLD